MNHVLKSVIEKASLVLFLLISNLIMAQPGYINPIDLLQGKRKVEIPFHFHHNFILLDVHLFGLLPVQLIFDTGAEHIILFKREYTDVLGVPYDRRIPIMGSDLSREIYALIVRNGLIEIDGMPPRTIDMLVLEENYFNLDEMIGAPIAGLIGGAFFKNFIINIDYKRNKLVLYDPSQFVAPTDFVALPLQIKTNKPYLNAEAILLDGTAVQVDLLLDTGSGVPLLLHNNSSPALHLPPSYIRGKLGMGLGGFLEGFVGRIGKLNVGEIQFPFVLTSFQDIDSAWLADRDKFRNGLIGNQLLSRFNVYLDYVHAVMYVKPYKNAQEPFDMDRSGLIVLAYGDDFNQFVVKDVAENSPAEAAGFQNGDILLRLQGLPVHLYTLDGVNTILQKKVGKTVRMMIRRGNETLRKSFILKDLI